MVQLTTKHSYEYQQNTIKLISNKRHYKLNILKKRSGSISATNIRQQIRRNTCIDTSQLEIHITIHVKESSLITQKMKFSIFVRSHRFQLQQFCHLNEEPTSYLQERRGIYSQKQREESITDFLLYHASSSHKKEKRGEGTTCSKNEGI